MRGRRGAKRWPVFAAPCSRSRPSSRDGWRRSSCWTCRFTRWPSSRSFSRCAGCSAIESHACAGDRLRGTESYRDGCLQVRAVQGRDRRGAVRRAGPDNGGSRWRRNARRRAKGEKSGWTGIGLLLIAGHLTLSQGRIAAKTRPRIGPERFGARALPENRPQLRGDGVASGVGVAATISFRTSSTSASRLLAR